MDGGKISRGGVEHASLAGVAARCRAFRRKRELISRECDYTAVFCTPFLRIAMPGAMPDCARCPVCCK